jgi:hypothetical protein
MINSRVLIFKIGFLFLSLSLHSIHHDHVVRARSTQYKCTRIPYLRTRFRPRTLCTNARVRNIFYIYAVVRGRFAQLKIMARTKTAIMIIVRSDLSSTSVHYTLQPLYTHTRARVHAYIYIYICVCVCVCTVYNSISI